MFKKMRIVFFAFVLLVQSALIEANLPRILIKIPTRARYEEFFKTLDLYYSKLSNKLPYHFVISCDDNDPVMNSPYVIKRFKNYPNLSYYFSNNRSKIEACNRDIDKHQDFDIVILGSDDMIPLIQGYDEIIATCMLSHYPDFDGVIQFNDGYAAGALNTFPVLGKKYYNRFGYIYNPLYKSFYCDTEMTFVSRMLNKCVYIDMMIVQHRHPAIGNGKNDLLYLQNDRYWAHDTKVFKERQLINFGLSKEEIINPHQPIKL